MEPSTISSPGQASPPAKSDIDVARELFAELAAASDPAPQADRRDSKTSETAVSGAVRSGMPPTAHTSASCPGCGAVMTRDQRYCLECGARKGEPRLPFMDGRTPPPAEPDARPPDPSSSPTRPGYPAPVEQPRQSLAGATLIAGVATLILAIGTGVLIGQTGSSRSSSEPLQVISAAAAPTTQTGATVATGATSSTASTGAAGDAGTPAEKKAKQQKLPPANVQLGQKGSGRGYTNGEFSGDFFGK